MRDHFLLFGLILLFLGACSTEETPQEPTLPTPDADHGGIVLPDNFGAIAVVDTLGRGRHIAVRDNGDIYVMLRRLNNEKGLMALRDTSGDGRADIIEGFGTATGTEVRIKDNFIYYSSDQYVFRSPLSEGELLPQNQIDTLIEFPEETTQGHGSKSFIFDHEGHIYVNVGSRSNACQEEARTKGSKGKDPCPELPNRAAIWQFELQAEKQMQADGKPYGVGIRNTVGLDWNYTNNKLYAMQHGRDDLFRFWPEYYTDVDSREIPAEELLIVEEGDDYGWPYCYYDPFQGKKLLAPEYGGNGKMQGRCSEVKQPIVAFPGHWGPNDLLFYTGDQFPARYKNGAFVAFHGSWNRINYAQAGFLVAFVPMKDGLPSGEWEIFADGFIGTDSITNPGKALYRPCGLAQGPDGSLYISDSQKGRVWRIFYYGEDSGISSKTTNSLASNQQNDDEAIALTGDMAKGQKLYQQHCLACHMDNGKGVPGMNPPVAGTDWVTGDKERLINVILKGMSEPTEINGETYQNAMASFDYLKDDEIALILSYIRNSFGNEASKISGEEVAAARENI